MTIRIILKSGADIPVTCTNVETTTRNGELRGYKFEGISENSPIYLAIDQVAAIVRVMSAEQALPTGGQDDD